MSLKSFYLWLMVATGSSHLTWGPSRQAAECQHTTRSRNERERERWKQCEAYPSLTWCMHHHHPNDDLFIFQSGLKPITQ
jgi:hypothetical protein